MRVLFDAYWWVEGPLSNQMVQRQFILTWLHEHPTDDVAVLVPAAHRDQAAAELPDRVTVLSTRLRPHAVAAVLALGRAARRHRADVIISHNFTPLRGVAVTFVHDVLFQSHPEWFTRAERVYLAPIGLLARRARAVVTSTRHEAAQIRTRNRHLGAVDHTGLAPAPSLTSADPVPPAALAGLGRFVLTVGRLNIRKNLARTVDAALASGAISAQCPLVVVGEPDGRGAGLGPDALAAREAGAVLFLSRVSDAELAWLYSHAALFVFVSLGEGYGLPPVEAAYFAAPVLVSDLPVFRETMGERARFVDATSTADIAAAMADLLGGAGARGPAGLLPHGDWSACTSRLRATVERIVK